MQYKDNECFNDSAILYRLSPTFSRVRIFVFYWHLADECGSVEVCEWTSWCDDEMGGGKITPDMAGEFELIEDCRAVNGDVCEEPVDVQCELAHEPHYGAEALGQDLTCDRNIGLVCPQNQQQPVCLDYRIRFLCCRRESNPNCKPSTSAATTTTSEPSTTAITPSAPVTTTTPAETTTRPQTTAKQTTNVQTTPPSTTRSGVKPITFTEPSYPVTSCSPIPSNNPTQISFDNCTTSEPVYFSECQGRCSSSYTFKKIIDGRVEMDEYCSCCQPETVIEDVIELDCPDNSRISVTIPMIISCTCNEVEC
ncbi:uncharacterized protein [Diadema antillarum]|uniref:uncharacterized protein n=1 Tax=Diadema antillarum TaxID=105358 RepID=UPI003A861AB7